MSKTRATAGYKGVSQAAAQRHYDVSDDFFRIWQGPDLNYAAAMWEDGDDTLEAAQARKTAYLIEQANVRPGSRVLDVGCGYGYELRTLVEKYQVAEAVGITLSEAGVDYLHKQDLPRCEVRLENYVDHRPRTPYDAIISVEAMEHFARPGLSGRSKIRSYRTFFERCHRMLRPDGRMTVQTITWGHRFPLNIQILSDLYLATSIYPECNPPFATEIMHACDGLFDVLELRNDRDHYARTAQMWVDRLRDDREHAAELIGRKKAMAFERCMGTAVQAFTEGWLTLHRFTFRPLPVRLRPARRFLVNNVLGRGGTPKT
ncbi:cyclopropane-fatty-acyl-phospholipid synthase [Sinosporangium album]|uniref:Cyclopropane-fatty-acyl-phospholipid synthase n=1 Tax=Sinosporangium album TaxID=504805 RepID=A0A1G7SHV1_9ACTN|nr:class I SAM-dependent methyltransferase [Sinosporangium album]SDG22531.1 cyclopropane-fatty-acyl-phospholipid synthase [Sinosporangium album]